MASRDLKELQLPAQDVFRAWLKDCADAGVEVLVYCTYRSPAEQNELYSHGRTKPGPVVTNATGGNSMHQYRVALDCVPMLMGKPQWDADKTYALMATLAKPHGIEWAGDWKRFREFPHFQYTQGLSLADFKAGKELHHGT